jgi:hypothetical protein
VPLINNCFVFFAGDEGISPTGQVKRTRCGMGPCATDIVKFFGHVGGFASDRPGSMSDSWPFWGKSSMISDKHACGH